MVTAVPAAGRAAGNCGRCAVQLCGVYAVGRVTPEGTRVCGAVRVAGALTVRWTAAGIRAAADGRVSVSGAPADAVQPDTSPAYAEPKPPVPFVV